MREDELPEGWAEVPLASVLSEPMANGRSVPDAIHGFPVLRLTALKGGRVDLSERKIGSWSEVEASRFRVREGDFLVARGNGSLALVGRGGLVEEVPDPVAYPDTLIRVRVRPDSLSTDWLRLVWNSQLVRRQIESTAHTSAGIHKVNQQELASILLPIPPLPEQKRIIAKVEGLLASVNASRERLARVPAILKRFRKSVHAAACAGRLTEKWRDNGPRSSIHGDPTERGGVDPSDLRVAAFLRGDLPESWISSSVGALTRNFDAARVPIKASDRGKRRGRYTYYGASGPIDTIDDFLFDGEFLLIGEDGANLLARSTPIAFRASGRFWGSF
jgi:Type I restriction modification DNA specificity domain